MEASKVQGRATTPATNLKTLKTMIIDLILDRKDGQKYDACRFYYDVMDYGKTWPEIAHPIARVMDSGTNADVQRELCRYIDEQGWNPEIKAWINEQIWID